MLIIDEAQNLTEELLEQVRLLSNIETDNRKLLQIVLLGQPELRDRLNSPRLRQLRQRITVRYHLEPLTRVEVAQYIQHRLELAGAKGRPTFTKPALWRVCNYSGGIPRLVNAVCDKALLAGFVEHSDLHHLPHGGPRHPRTRREHPPVSDPVDSRKLHPLAHESRQRCSCRPVSRMFLRKPFAASPLLARVAPFVIFLALTFGQGQFGEASRYWFYLAKTLVGVWLIWEMRPFVSEMRWAVSWEAVVVGVGIFAVWVGISGDWTTQNSLWIKLGLSHPPAATPKLWNPNEQFGAGSALAWLLMADANLGFHPGRAAAGGGFLPLVFVSLHRQTGFSVRAAEPVFLDAVSGDRRRVRVFPQRMAGGHPVRRGVSSGW